MKPTTDLHVTLPSHLLASLDRLARQRGTPRSGLVREALVDYVRRLESGGTEQEMREYVHELGPYSAEFVAETEAHVSQRLPDEIEW